MSQEDAYSFETMSLIRVWVLLVIELLDRSKVLKVKLLSSQFPPLKVRRSLSPRLGAEYHFATSLTRVSRCRGGDWWL